MLSGKGERDKKNVYVWYKGKAWARTVDYGVLLTNNKKKYACQKFTGHYDESKLNLDSVSEQERTVLLNLRSVIDDLARVR